MITVAQASPGLLAHFPDVVRLPGGRLLAAYREGAGHVRSDGRIRVVDSDDGGLTWGAPRVAVDGRYDDRDPKLTVLADGTVLLSWFVLEWGGERGHRSRGTYLSRSADGGLTWTGPAAVGIDWAVSHGAAVQLTGGDVLLPLYGRPEPGARERAVVVRSGDGGRSWQPESLVTIAADEEVSYQEPTLTIVEEQVVALIRTAAGHACLSRSVDGGRTWSRPERTDMPASSHHALALSTGEVLVTYGDLSPRFSAHRDTVGRLIRRPADSWDGYRDVPVYDSGHPDQANPSSVEVTPGGFLTLGFDVTAATVVGVFTSVTDFD